MKKTILLFLLLPLGLISIDASGQSLIEGRVYDRGTGEAIEYASVALYRLPDSTLLTGVVTDAAGAFEITDAPPDSAYLAIQFMGYEPYFSAAFQAGDRLDVGTIRLGISTAVFSEVEVTGKETTSLHRLDRQVFDAGQFQNARGGSAADVLANLPAVSINSQGEISVRGATGFVLMINGKPVQSAPRVLLNQLAANAIDDIEIITAPSAKYDPDGKAGIINIKTRQPIQEGFFLSANAQGGLPSVEPYANAEPAHRYGADLTLNWRKNKWDVSVGADYRRDDLAGRRVGYVNTYVDGVFTEFPSDGERSFDRENYSGRLSALYHPDERNTVGASFYAGKRTQYRTADILYDYQQRTRIPADQFLDPEAYWDLYRDRGTVFQGGERIDSLTYFNENLRVRRGDFLIGALDYSYRFADASMLKFSGLYEHTILGGPTDNINLAWPDTRDTLQLQYNDNDNPLDGLRLQVDYSSRLGSATWESGYLYRYLRHPGDFIYLDRDFDAGDWIVNPEFTNRIELERRIHALYSQVSGTWGKLQYTAGIRLEYADRHVALAEPDTTYRLQLVNPFPSINLQYALGEELYLKAAYSRRIERTTTLKMTPFPEREHSETLEQGDAELRPEFIDLAELGVVKNWGDHSAYATAYFRDVADVINRVNTIYNDTILNRIYTNAGQAMALGLEAGLTLYPASWWRVTLGGNVFRYRIQGQLFGDDINTANTVFSFNGNTRFQLLPTMELQIGLSYLSERITAQGVDSRFYNPNLTLRKTFLDERLALSLQWLNIDMGLLESNEQRITTVRKDFYTTTNYIYEVDILMLSLSYRLNQPSQKVKLLESEFGDKEF